MSVCRCSVCQCIGVLGVGRCQPVVIEGFASISASVQRERFEVSSEGGGGGKGRQLVRVSRARVLSRFGLHVAAGGMTSSSVGASRVSSFLTRPIKVIRSCFRDKF